VAAVHEGEETALGWEQWQGWDGNRARNGDGDGDREHESQGDTSAFPGTVL